MSIPYCSDHQRWHTGKERCPLCQSGAPATPTFENQAQDLIPAAVEILKATRRASTSLFQRRLRIGYNQAARIMEHLENLGIVGPENGSSPREIYGAIETFDAASIPSAIPKLSPQPIQPNSMATTTDKAATITELFNALQMRAHANSCQKGFWRPHGELLTSPPESENRTNMLIAWKLSRIALMHSELSECLEGIRKGLKDDHLPHRSMEICELADTVIRILDYAGAYELPLMEVILEKMAYNSTREFMHGKQA